MSEKTYVLIEVEDGCLAYTRVGGGGDVGLISIDWDEIVNDLQVAEDKLGEVVTAIDDLKTQGRKDTGDLEKIAHRLEGTIEDLTEDAECDEDHEEDELDDNETCEDCGHDVNGCRCPDADDEPEDNGDHGEHPECKTMISMPGHNHAKGTKDFPAGGYNAATVGDLIEFLKNAIDKGMPLNTPLEFGCERHHKRDRRDFERLNPRIDQIEWFVHEDIPAGEYGRDWLTILMAFDRRSEND